MVNIIESLSEISTAYDTVFCDLWGCLHNGVTAYPEAVEALRSFRSKGGVVVLLTNSPRPRSSVQRQIGKMNVPDDCWDTIASSGDSARAAMFQGVVGRRVYHIGPPHDAAFFEPMQLLPDAPQVERVSLDEADGIVCTGPDDATADPDVNRPTFLVAKQRGLKLLCANPDVVVDRGERREWCAGALAELYAEMGGESLYFGKPHPPIYDLAYRRLAAIRSVSKDRVLAIGDGMNTDIRGALGEDIDTLFVTGGLAARDTGTERQPDSTKLKQYLQSIDIVPNYAIGFLR